MKRQTKPKPPSEKRVQGHIVNTLRSLGFFVSTLSQAQRAQQTAGLPDVFAAHARWGSVWIEVKRPDRRTDLRGGLSLEQLQWHLNVKACGVNVITAYGTADVLDHLKRMGVHIS